MRPQEGLGSEDETRRSFPQTGTRGSTGKHTITVSVKVCRALKLRVMQELEQLLEK